MFVSLGMHLTPYATDMLFGVSSDMLNVIIHAKFYVDRLRGFWAAGPPKVPFSILIGTTLTTVLHYRADCDVFVFLEVAVSTCCVILLTILDLIMLSCMNLYVALFVDNKRV